jgi:quercetin dioxygenase-like cupin family protein
MRTALIAATTFLLGVLATYAGSGVQGGPTHQSPGGTKLRVLMDATAIGGTEVEVGELTFVANSDSGDHQHGVTETFYVLDGELEHIVNGKGVKLGPGMTGTVRPPDKVRHKTGPAGARALVIWAPGGEIARVTARWKRIN